jgi:hypothetical protein
VEELKQDVSYSHGRPVGSSKMNVDFKYNTMKKVSTGMGLIQFILFIFLLFIIVTLSACNVSGNVSMNGKGLIVDQLKGMKPSVRDRQSANTIHNEQLTGDFRYYYLLK